MAMSDDSVPAETYELKTGPDDDQATELEKREVNQYLAEYRLAKQFDENPRRQYAIDRRYAAGTALSEWAVDANLLGSYIDILVSYIYARDPDVAIRPTQAAKRAHPRHHQDWAETLEIVVRRLWRDGKLKRAMKKVVRSGYSVGIGWFKSNVLTDSRPDPKIQREINTTKDNLERVRVQRELIESGEAADVELEQRRLERYLQGLEAQVEIITRKMLAIDFCAAETIQVSLEVSDLDDYLDSPWISHDLYYRKDRLREEFPALTDDDVKRATTYYQQQPTDLTEQTDLNPRDVQAGHADKFSTGDQASSQSANLLKDGDGRAVEFAKAIEIWDRTDNLIKTAVEGVDRWAEPPYAPRYGTSRFYPFFKVDFFPVDGERHPQSLAWRLHRLQDEYAHSRSNFRETRRRSIPGVIFNAAVVGPDEAKKLTDSEAGEYTGLELGDPDVDLLKAFREKPIPNIDIALFDNAPIIGDMEKISGVQEALQSSHTRDKTATQAQIEQSGFEARTTAQRDSVEDTLSDFAEYSAELALQCIDAPEAQRIAGPQAFWPEDLPLEEATTLMDIEIEAGTTGKPNTAAEREAWATLLPLLRELVMRIAKFRLMGDNGTAEALTELLRETAKRLGDRIDVERFIPTPPQLGPDGLPVDAQTGQPIRAAGGEGEGDDGATGDQATGPGSRAGGADAPNAPAAPLPDEGGGAPAGAGAGGY